MPDPQKGNKPKAARSSELQFHTLSEIVSRRYPPLHIASTTGVLSQSVLDGAIWNVRDAEIPWIHDGFFGPGTSLSVEL